MWESDEEQVVWRRYLEFFTLTVMVSVDEGLGNSWYPSLGTPVCDVSQTPLPNFCVIPVADV